MRTAQRLGCGPGRLDRIQPWGVLWSDWVKLSAAWSEPTAVSALCRGWGWRPPQASASASEPLIM